MGRGRVEIKPIEDRSKRFIAFTRRRQALFKKTRECCDSFGAEAAVIAFSAAGNVFGFGHPAVNLVVGRYLADPASSSLPEVNGVGEMAPPLTEMEKVIAEAVANGRPAWDVTVRNLGLSEINELDATMRMIKSMVAARAMEVAANGGESSLGACCLNPGVEESTIL